MSLYNSQSSRKCFSSSAAEDSQNMQSLSVNGVLGLVYRPVSIASGKLQDLNLNKTRRWSLDNGSVQYNSLFKLTLYVLYVFSDTFNDCVHFSTSLLQRHILILSRAKRIGKSYCLPEKNEKFYYMRFFFVVWYICFVLLFYYLLCNNALIKWLFWGCIDWCKTLA